MSEPRMAVVDPISDSIPLRLLEWFLSALGGALVTLVAFRTKLALNDRELAAHKKDVARELAEHASDLKEYRNDIAAEAMRAERAFRESLEALRRENDGRHDENRAQLRLMRRQQFLTLKMIADIARHTGADKRFDDEIWRALADGEEDKR